MVTELLDAIVSWKTFLVVLVVFGFAPGAVLRLIVLAFHRDDPRRREMLAELHRVPRWERPLWVSEQLEVVLFEGIWERVWGVIARRILRRNNTGSPIIWHRSMSSSGYGSVEVAFVYDQELARDLKNRPEGESRLKAALIDGQVTLRDSNNQRGPVLRFNEAEWQAFLDGIRRGEFNRDRHDAQVVKVEHPRDKRP